MPLLLFLLWVVLEILSMIGVGLWLGFIPTILLILMTTIGGVMLFRYQAAKMHARVMSSEFEGGDADEKNTNFYPYVCAALLILPGFISDVFALLLWIPSLRNILFVYLNKRIAEKIVLHSRFYQDFVNGGAEGFYEQHGFDGRGYSGHVVQGEVISEEGEEKTHRLDDRTR